MMTLKETRKHLKRRVDTFRNLFIPLYLEGKFDFVGMVKQIFWLVEIEQEMLGKQDIGSWKKLNDAVKDENHIVHLNYEYRQNKPKDEKLREEYIERLNAYLDELEEALSSGANANER